MRPREVGDALKLVETSVGVRGMSQRNSTAQRLVFAAQQRVKLGKTRFNANSRKRPLAFPAFWGETTASLATREESARGTKSALAQSIHPRLSQSLFANAVRTPSCVKPARAAVHCNEKSSPTAEPRTKLRGAAAVARRRLVGHATQLRPGPPQACVCAPETYPRAHAGFEAKQF